MSLPDPDDAEPSLNKKLPPAPGWLELLAVLGFLILIAVVWCLLYLVWPHGVFRYFRLWLPLIAFPYWAVLQTQLAGRYGVDLAGRGQRGQASSAGDVRLRRAKRRIVRWIFGYILTPIIAFLLVAFMLAGVVPGWDAAHNGGTVGTLTLQYEQCDSSCTWYGDFLADDFTIDYSDVEMADPVPGAQVGLAVLARYEDLSSEAYAYSGSTDWIKWAVPAVVSLGYVGISLFFMGRRLIRWSRRRRNDRLALLPSA